MLRSRKLRLLLCPLAFICWVPSLSASIVEGRLYHGKVVHCVHGGGWINEPQLGVFSRARLYDLVMTGTVDSAVEISFTDKRLQIVPDEVFLGHATGAITATVNQACLPEGLPEIKAGDKWIFYLRTNVNTADFWVISDSPSMPVSQARYDICLLRLYRDDDESCGEPPTPRRLARSIDCDLDVQSFQVANPVAPPISLGRQPAPILSNGIDLTRVTVPPEFRHVSRTGNDIGIYLQAYRGCPSDSHSDGQRH
jgi:hypothetical protein